MKKSAFAADRTIAFESVYLGLSFNLKLHPAAVASAAVFDQVTFLRPAQLGGCFHLLVIRTTAGGAVALGAVIENFLRRRDVGGIASPRFQCRIL